MNIGIAIAICTGIGIPLLTLAFNFGKSRAEKSAIAREVIELKQLSTSVLEQITQMRLDLQEDKGEHNLINLRIEHLEAELIQIHGKLDELEPLAIQKEMS